uniref:WD repeat and SOCS box containing 2 n=1 Tax=Pavo cristatus TaxID=9049 RepID=A0A8C9GDV2_PAVCR
MPPHRAPGCHPQQAPVPAQPHRPRLRHTPYLSSDPSRARLRAGARRQPLRIAAPYDWKSSCETWSVAFSSDGAWFAWSQGHCLVKLIPWPLQEAELHKAEAKRSRAGAKEKTLECGQIVWGLAFSAWPAAQHPDGAAGLCCQVLATGLNDGQIKVWEVQTGHLLFSLLGHQDVVRDLSFAPNGSLILVSASRDRTLRVWDLSRDGRREWGWPWCSRAPSHLRRRDSGRGALGWYLRQKWAFWDTAEASAPRQDLRAAGRGRK